MKNISSLLIIFFVLAVVSCKKEADTKITSKNESLIIGRWQVYQRHTQVFEAAGDVVLKDTIVTYAPGKNIVWWFEIYDASGNAYVTGKPYTVSGVQKADTTTFSHYTITGSSIIYKTNGGGSETKPILNLTENEMDLKSEYVDLGRPSWGLDGKLEYRYVDETFYKKQ